MSLSKIIVLASLCIGLIAKASSSLVFSPYADLSINAHWDPIYQDMEPMDLVELSSHNGVTDYHLAFITNAGSSCNPAWAGQPDYSIKNAWAVHLTDKMRAHAIGYTISFGGANGADLSSVCSREQLVSAYEQIIKTYQPNGLDFDIENSAVDVPKLIDALQEVQTHNPNLKISFTLPTLPEGLISAGQAVVRSAQKSHLKNYLINIMAMDYGPAYTNDMGQYAMQAASNLFAFLKKLYPEKSDAALWQMIGITPMIGVNDTNIEKFTLEDTDQLRTFAERVNISLLSMWSAARDNPCADAWASPVCSGANLQHDPNEYAKHFLSNTAAHYERKRS